MDTESKPEKVSLIRMHQVNKFCYFQHQFRSKQDCSKHTRWTKIDSVECSGAGKKAFSKGSGYFAVDGNLPSETILP